MPEKTHTITMNGLSADALLALAFGSFKKLDWKIQYAVENVVVAHTSRKLNRWEMEITAKAADNQLSITSKMIHGELFDMMGRNQKNIDQFAAAFESLSLQSGSEEINTWQNLLNQQKQETIKMIAETEKQAAEIDRVMHFSKSNLFVTYGIIAINLVVFVLMIIDGAAIFEPNGILHIKWGSNFSPLTLSGDWWRILSSVFLHFGILHIAMNMYGLYMVGIYLEPMLGKIKYTAAYLCTGALANLVSLWWHNDGVNGAGASGAIFGLYGLFLAFLTTRLIPKAIKSGLLQSVGVVVVYSLVYGMKGGVDNAAHVGGLVSGFIIGYLYYLWQKNYPGNNDVPIAIFIMGVTALASYFYLGKNKIPIGDRLQTEKELKELSFSDSKAYNEKLAAFSEIEMKTIKLINDSLNNTNANRQRIENTSMENWDRAAALMNEAMKLSVSEQAKQKARLLKEYAAIRKEEARLLFQVGENADQTLFDKLDETKKKLNDKLEEINKLQ